MAFEVVYCPRAGLADFVVKAERVEQSLNMFWTSGMRIKMAIETEDSSRMAWFQGTISSVLVPHPDNNGPWGTSPWRMLQVIWDEPEVLQNVKRGARQDPFFVSSLANFNSETTHQTCSDIFFGNNMTLELKTVSAELDIGRNSLTISRPIVRRVCISLAMNKLENRVATPQQKSVQFIPAVWCMDTRGWSYEQWQWHL